MWLKEGCIVVPLPLNKPLEDLASFRNLLDLYTKNVLYLAQKTPVYLLLEPTPIAVKLRNIKRSIVFPMLSSVICNDYVDLFNNAYKIIEGVWAKVGIVTPYVIYNSCNTSRLQKLGLILNPLRGIPYICLDKVYVDNKLGLRILNGGFIEITYSKKEIGQQITITVSRDPLTALLKNVVNTLKIYIPGEEMIKFSPFDIDRSLSIYSKTIAFTNGKPIIISIGKGFIFALDLSNDIAQILYNLIILTAFTVSIDI